MSAGIGCQRPGVYVWGLHIDGQPQALDLDYLESISSAVAFDGLLGLGNTVSERRGCGCEVIVVLAIFARAG